MADPATREYGESFDPIDRVTLTGDGSVTGLSDTLDSASGSKLFNGPFTRLWIAQVVASLGDWIGLVAILAIANRVSGSGSSGSAIGVVLIARMAPGFFFASVAGVLVDRWDRKRVMVVCNLGRAIVLATLPFVDTIWGLVLASLALEVMTLLWAPAKEAMVPNLVATEHLSAANSLSLVAAYGTMPVATAMSAGLFKVAERLAEVDALSFLEVNRESVAIYFNVFAFAVSALLIATLRLPRRERNTAGRINLRGAFDDLKDGLQFIRSSPVVRAVILGLATGLFGGGMVIPLGPDFSEQVLGAGAAGFSLLLTALGVGVAGGVLALSAVQKRLPRERIFVLSAFGAGLSLLLAASTSTLTPALLAVALMGVCAGSVYVVGFTLLHENVADELRGRIFATLNTLVRFCLLGSLALTPFISELLGGLSSALFGDDREAAIGEYVIGLSGVRLTLWLGGIVIIGAGFLIVTTLRREPDRARGG